MAAHAHKQGVTSDRNSSLSPSLLSCFCAVLFVSKYDRKNFTNVPPMPLYSAPRLLWWAQAVGTSNKLAGFNACLGVLQILSSKQLALVFVHAYPYIPILEILLNTIATREGYPAPEEVSASAQQGASMTAAWNDFDVYSMSIHQNMFSEERGVYVPLSWHTAPPAQSKPCYNDVISAGHLISA